MIRTKALTTLLSKAFKVSADNNARFARTLYSPAALGIDGFMHARERTKLQIANVDTFKLKMQEFVKDENSKNLIFTEDLKNMLHISDKNDLGLLSQMIEKFCSQSKEVRFGNFVFGPPVMRLMHHLKDADAALKLFKNDTLDGFFDQLVSYQILFDLLYESGRYQDVLDTFNIVKARQVQGGRYPKHVLVLALASCYKLNTPESLKYATELWKEATDSGHIPMRRGVTFLAALALNQGAPHVALEIMSNVKQQNYLTIRTIRALALAKLKRYDDVLPIIRSVLEIDNPMINKQTFPAAMIEQLKKDFEENTNKDLQTDFKKVVGFLEKQGHITPNALDDILCTEIQQTAQFHQNADGSGRRDDYGRRDYGDNYERRDDYGRRDYGDNYERRDNRRFPQQRREFDSTRSRRPGLHELN